MPYLELTTQAPLPKAPQLQELLMELAARVAHELGKSPEYVMTSARQAEGMVFSNSPEACCYVSLRGIGEFGGDRMDGLSQAICRLIQDHLEVPADRVFIVFDEVRRTHWAVRGKTLA